MAFVTERYSEIKDNIPSQFIANKFCKEKYLNKIFDRTDAFEIHSLKKYKYEGFNINSWVRLKSSNLADEIKTPILLVVNDINTYSESEINFNEEDIVRFFKNIPNHLESILKLYF
ncbi:MAG: hypothetical protein ACE5KE_09220 [Methanosarcinales archaeon]